MSLSYLEGDLVDVSAIRERLRQEPRRGARIFLKNLRAAYGEARHEVTSRPYVLPAAYRTASALGLSVLAILVIKHFVI